MATKRTDGPVYSWLKRHAWLIGIAIAAAGVLVPAILALRDAPSMPVPTVDANRAAEPAVTLDPEAAAQESRNKRAAELYALAREKRPDVDSFLFADYEHPKSGRLKGWVYIYAATKNRFVEIDRQSCSYPDASSILSDFDQRYLLMTCSYPYFLEREALGEQKYSSVVTTVRFFDSDRKVSDILACNCEHLVAFNPAFDVQQKALELTLTSEGEVIGGPGDTIRYDINEDAIRVRTVFDESWEAVSFSRVRR